MKICAIIVFFLGIAASILSVAIEEYRTATWAGIATVWAYNYIRVIQKS